MSDDEHDSNPIKALFEGMAAQHDAHRKRINSAALTMGAVNTPHNLRSIFRAWADDDQLFRAGDLVRVKPGFNHLTHTGLFVVLETNYDDAANRIGFDLNAGSEITLLSCLYGERLDVRLGWLDDDNHVRFQWIDSRRLALAAENDEEEG